jgi:hypothetical protein
MIEVVNVKDFGAVGDGVRDDMSAIRDAVALASSFVFFPPGTYRVGADITFSVALVFAPGARLKPNAGVTITVNGEILAPKDSVIFEVSNGGSFQVTWTGELIANWWSGGDIGEQVNNMFASIDLRNPRPLARTARVRIIGDADLTTSINMTNLRPVGGLVVTMEGRLLCKVGADKPAIDMVSSRGIIAMNWCLYGDPTTKSGTGVLCARTPNPEPGKSPKSAGNHKFVNLRIGGEWVTSPVYLIDSENNYFQNLDIRTQGGKYGFSFGGTNVDGVVSPHLPIDDSSSQTNLHIDGLYMRAKDITEGGFYVSGADRVHLSGLTYIFTNTSPKVVLDMNVAGIMGFWCDGLHGEGGSKDAISVIGSGKRLSNVFIRSLGLGAQENAIHLDARHPDGSHGQMFIRNARFDFLDTTAFRCSGNVKMEQKVEIVTRGDDDSPNIIIGNVNPATGEESVTDFNGEIWGGDISKLTVASRIMAGLYHDGVHNVVHEFKHWPVLTFPDERDSDGVQHPSVAGGIRFRTANSAPTTIRNFLDAQRGQEITILIDDENTTIQHSRNICLQGGVDFVGSRGDMITLVKMGAGFTEKSRSINLCPPSS